MQAMTGVLPGGYWDAAGVLHREFELGVLTGREEEILAQTRRSESASVYRMMLSESAALDQDREVMFRLPNGADQEAVSPLLAHNEAEALTRLLARSIQQIGSMAPVVDERVAALSPAARAEIEAEME